MSVKLTGRAPEIPPAGANVVVRKDYREGPYIVRGVLGGIEMHPDGPAVRVRCEDGYDRVVLLPAQVTAE